ncbi:response regulator [Luteimonas sp. S4-F44]|uniref:response regulator n=1 Tax=Luteimonas sp. S4-F44 TaxID=2925842 RepID=UPI0031BB46AE
MSRILLVEDEPAIADTVAYALRAEGHQVRHCLDGRTALAAAAAETFDLAILDVGLPDVSGFALCAALRRRRCCARTARRGSTRSVSRWSIRWMPTCAPIAPASTACCSCC